MGYPFILAYNGDHFARVNHEGSWSVIWEKAINVRYEPLTNRNRAIVACATALVAAKDNFFLTPWDKSDQWKDKWDHLPKTIDLRTTDPDDGEIEFSINKGKEKPCARVNFDGTWSIVWDMVDQVARQKDENWRTVALSGFCRMLMAAQYRFQVTPWKDTDDEEDDE